MCIGLHVCIGLSRSDDLILSNVSMRFPIISYNFKNMIFREVTYRGNRNPRIDACGGKYCL